MKNKIRSIWLPIGKEPIIKEFNSCSEEYSEGTKFITENNKYDNWTDHISLHYSPSVINENLPNEQCLLYIRFDDKGKLDGNVQNRRIVIKSLTQNFDDIIFGNITVSKMKGNAEDCCDFEDAELDFFIKMFSLENKDKVPEKYYNLRSETQDMLLKMYLGLM